MRLLRRKDGIIQLLCFEKKLKILKIDPDPITSVLWALPRVKKEERSKVFGELNQELLEIEGQCEIEHAHRTAGQQPGAGDRPRTILARFLRCLNRELVLREARYKGKLTWQNNIIMLFPDFSRATKIKCDKFKRCKKKLHKREVRFRILYPAKLKIDAKEGVKTFECP